jgi:LacI family transcriptional regulator
LAANIRDVARNAGVSVGTVSRVLNTHPSVSATLKERVEKAIRETGFRPNARARNLARKSSGCIGFLVANRPVVQPFTAWVLNGVMQHCEERGYFVLGSIFQYSPASPLSTEDLPRLLRIDSAIDALILAGTNFPNFVDCLESMKIPYVLAGNSFLADAGRSRTDQVRLDHAASGRQATEYLIQLGHRDIWYIGDLSTPWYVERYEGYCQAMRDAGLEPLAQVEGLADDRFLNGFHSAEMILSQNQPVTAIIGGTNEVAYGAWEAAERRKLAIPNDISLVGFDDERTTHKSHPLTTMWVDAEEEGRQLAKMAISKIHSPGVTLPEVIIPTHLVKFGTCRAILSRTPHAQ